MYVDQLLNTFADVPSHDLCGPLAVLLRLNLRVGSVLTQEDGHLSSNLLNLCYPRGCSQPNSEMLLKHSKTNPRMTCAAPTQSCSDPALLPVWEVMWASEQSVLGIRDFVITVKGG